MRSGSSAPARLVLLGTAGGAVTDPPDPPGGPTRCGISSLVVVGDAYYLVDFGMGSARQLTHAMLPESPPRTTLSRLRAGFITHLHSDHVMDLANVVLSGFVQGWPKTAVPVFGPGPASVFTDDHRASTRGEQAEPHRAAPGTAAMLRALGTAFAADLGDRFASHPGSWSEMVVGRDIAIPETDQKPRPPWLVYRDEKVQVTATLVDHGRMRPAFGYRFDTASGSVVFSGDTSPSPNLIELARGADILVHEVVHESVARLLFGESPTTERENQVVERVLAKHTNVREVGAIAQAAEVGTLVLSHLVPASAPEELWRDGVGGFSGRVVVGRDLLEIPVSW